MGPFNRWGLALVFATTWDWGRHVNTYLDLCVHWICRCPRTIFRERFETIYLGHWFHQPHHGELFEVIS